MSVNETRQVNLLNQQITYEVIQAEDELEFWSQKYEHGKIILNGGHALAIFNIIPELAQTSDTQFYYVEYAGFISRRPELEGKTFNQVVFSLKDLKEAYLKLQSVDSVGANEILRMLENEKSNKAMTAKGKILKLATEQLINFKLSIGKLTEEDVTDEF